MDTTTFLRTILPSKGLYVAARLTNKGFRNQVCESVEELAQQVLMSDSQGVPSYHACAAYREHSVEGVKDGKPIKQVRTHRNVRALQSFYMDLDVKPGVATAFDSQETAIGDLVSFCRAVAIPCPMVVSSGGGIHVYWTLTHEIQPEAWKVTAEGLKLLAAKLGFKADPACTADMARVLRPVGTWNRKDPNNPRPVELVADSVAIGYAAFDALVKAALKAQGVKPPDGIRKVESTTETINQDFAVQREFPPCSGIKVAERCQQMRVVRDRRGDVPEPVWYSAIQVLCHSIEGDELIHSWSNGHASYSVDETNRKIQQLRSQSLGPTLCTTIEGRNPGGCEGCPFLGKISSPAQLGAIVKSAPPPVVEFETGNGTEIVTLPNPPEPYKRREGGGITVEVDGITHIIHEHDIFPVEVANDEFLGYETMRWRHFHPMQGWNEFVLRSSLVAKPVELEIAFRDKNIQPLIRNQMALFADNYIRKLKAEIKIRKLFKAQGWKNDDTEFVLGDKLYRKGEILQAGSSQSAKGFLKPFHSRGSLDVWRNLTWVFNTPKFEAHAFMLLLAFAAPLLKISGRQGFTVNALGDTSAGKTTMARFMTSVYGHPDASWPTIEDSALARVQRMGAHNNLPIYMDESTTIDPKELRNLIYSIPIGKSRTTMKQDYTTREGAEWQTIFVTSTNDSLQGKLQLEKANAEAESLRLFELNFPVVPEFGPIAKIIWGTVDANYGVAGPKYIEHIVNDLEQIKARLTDKTNNVVLQTEREFGMQDKERFWSQAVALTLYGGQLAHDAGVIDFDPARIKRWLLAETQRMRGGVKGLRSDAVSILSAYMNEHIGGRIIINPINSAAMTYGSRHMNKITSRYEAENHLIYEDRTTMYKEWRAKHISPEAIRDELYAKGVLLDHDKKVTLTKDTGYGGGQVVCWMIRADHPELNLTDL